MTVFAERWIENEDREERQSVTKRKAVSPFVSIIFPTTTRSTSPACLQSASLRDREGKSSGQGTEKQGRGRGRGRERERERERKKKKSR